MLCKVCNKPAHPDYMDLCYACAHKEIGRTKIIKDGLLSNLRAYNDWLTQSHAEAGYHDAFRHLMVLVSEGKVEYKIKETKHTIRFWFRYVQG